MTRQAETIERRYRDALGRWRQVPARTIDRIAAVLQHDAPPRDTVRIVRPGQHTTIEEAAELILETGTREVLSRVGGPGRRRWQLPADVPFGYHALEMVDTGRRVSLIVAPERCHLPDGLRLWAWAVQLYATRSRRSWGIGDFADLARFATAARQQACGLLLVNPLHAAAPVVPQQPSPYSPTTRRFLNPLYLSVTELPGGRDLPDAESTARAGQALNERPLIDRDRIFRLKMRALDALFRRFDGDPAFDAFTAREGGALLEYATYCVLAEEHGGNWRRWPARFRHPHSPDVRRFAQARDRRVRFHQWLQWHLDRQLARAAAIVPVMQDLPIGIDPDGADAWSWQDVLAPEMAVGAPPDEFNTRGQNWGLPPFVPDRLRAAAYRPFIETIRGTMRHAGGLRIDHVMGLFRLFWIPEGESPADGAFVRGHASDLLAIVALESQRAGAIVVGEDLGTVDDAAREQLLASAILSYRLLWFEKDPPSRYPEQALAAVTTHDLPTIAGLWNGTDLEAQRRLHLHPNEAGTREIRERLARWTRSTSRTPVREVIRRTHALLAGAPSVVVSATIEDAAAVAERPNMPGTITEWPNWSRPLPVPLERLTGAAQTRALARLLSARPPGRRQRARRRTGRRTSRSKAA